MRRGVQNKVLIQPNERRIVRHANDQLAAGLHKLNARTQELSHFAYMLEHLERAPHDDVAATVEAALEAGAGYMDLFMPTAGIRDSIGRLMKGRRERFQIQGHIGACLTNDGQYCRSRDPVQSERHAEDLLRRLGTDYVDTLMVHFVDEADDWVEASAAGGILEITERWKQQGKARLVGMSSHKVAVSMAAVKSGRIDVLMFPVNPAFDLLPGEIAIQALWEPEPYDGLKTGGCRPAYTRRELFLACEQRGVAVVAMKPFAGGLLFRNENPSGIVLSPVQCIHYALSQPGVRTVVPGCTTPQQMKASLAWLTASPDEKDYSAVLETTDWNLSGRCVYCNHCLPCPAGIDIAAVMRVYDGARNLGITPALAATYGRFGSSAADCVECGDCDERCPFDVEVQARMADAAALLG